MYIFLPVIAVFVCARLVKNCAYRMQQSIFNRFYTLILVSVSNRLPAIRCSQPCSCVRLA